MRPLFALLVGAITALAQSYTIATIAGTDISGDGGLATQAILIQAEGLALDANGNLYIADAGANCIRKVLADGAITTIAGTGVAGFSGDGGPAVSAELNAPYGLALDSNSNLYVADLGNGLVRKISTDGIITTVAGGPKPTASATNTSTTPTAPATPTLVAPRDLAFDLTGNLYISDFSGHQILLLNTAGTLEAFAGTGTGGYSGDGGAANAATVNYPAGLAFDFFGRLYIADSGNHAIRMVAGGTISTVETATTPTGLAFDELGTLYVADYGAGEILRFAVWGVAPPWKVPALDLAFNATGTLYTSGGSVVRAVSQASFATAVTPAVVAGGGSSASGDGGPATLARLFHPSGTAVDSSGNLYIADRDNCRIRMIAPDGVISTLAGTGACGNTGDAGPAIQATLSSPSSVSVDSSGNLYIADTGNNRVRKVTKGTISAFAGDGTQGSAGDNVAAVEAELNAPGGVLAGPDGSVWIADTGNGQIRRVTPGGLMALVAQGLKSPSGLALDASGNLYYTDSATASVAEISFLGIHNAACAWILEHS